MNKYYHLPIKFILLYMTIALLQNNCYGLEKNTQSSNNTIVIDNKKKLKNQTDDSQKKIINQSQANTKSKPEYIFPNWSGSIMFDRLLLDKLNKAFANSNDESGQEKKSPKSTINLIDNGKSKVPKKSAPIVKKESEIPPVFYLGTLFYLSDQNWVIWINNTKITSEEKSNLELIRDTLDIAEIHKDFVIFSRQTAILYKLSPGWEKKLLPDPLDRLNFTNDSNNINVESRENLYRVKFTLYPNQKFSVYEMEITEGNK